jgi:hypothetical protein
MDLRTVTAKVLAERSRDKRKERTSADLVGPGDQPVVVEGGADDAPLTPGLSGTVGVGVLPGGAADGLTAEAPVRVDVNELGGLRDRLVVDAAVDEGHSTLDDRHRSGVLGSAPLRNPQHRPQQSSIGLVTDADDQIEDHHRSARQDTEIEGHRDDDEGHRRGRVQSVDRDGHSSHSERRGGQQQRDVLGPPGVADDPRVSGIHGRSVSADDQPSPVNQSALSVNPVGYDLGNFNGDGEDGSAPFIYDRGTQTIHLAPQGARHDQIKRWAGNKIQGPIYQGWQDGYTIDYHHAPQRHEREAIEQALQKHTGLPLEDVNLYDNDDQFNLYSKRRRKLANKCAVCGDLLQGCGLPALQLGRLGQRPGQHQEPE